jgi:hypothetical protein
MCPIDALGVIGALTREPALHSRICLSHAQIEPRERPAEARISSIEGGVSPASSAATLFSYLRSGLPQR